MFLKLDLVANICTKDLSPTRQVKSSCIFVSTFRPVDYAFVVGYLLIFRGCIQQLILFINIKLCTSFRQLMTSYVLATGGALVTALSLNNFVKVLSSEK